MRIGEVARKSGMSASQIRYYERLGLITPPNRTSGQRDYDSEILQTLHTIKIAKQHDFSLEEIRDLLHNDNANHSIADKWREIAKHKLNDVQQQIKYYQAIQQTLLDSIDCTCDTLETCEFVMAK